MIQQVRLAVTLLRAHVPVLVVGERLGQQVRANPFSNAKFHLLALYRCLRKCRKWFQQASPQPSETNLRIYSYIDLPRVHQRDLHALSIASNVTDLLDSVLQRRGQSTLVPRDSREIVLSLSDLSTPTSTSFDRVTSIIKDLLEPRKLFLDHGSGYNVQDVTLLCKLSPKGTLFQNRRCLQRFFCLYARDNFEESVEAFSSQLTKKFPEVSIEVGKVAEAARRMLNTSVKSYSSLSMVLTSDIIVDLLSSLAEVTLTSGSQVLAEFCRRLHQSLVSPAIDLTQQKMVQQWITTSLAAAGITYGLEYDHEVSEDAFPADINLTEQQQQQAREVLQFLHNEQEQFVSLYGNYGYGKTIVLSVATDLAGFVIEEVKTLDQLRTVVSLKKEKLLILLRDTYIEKSNMRGWLSVLTATENIHKVQIFLC